MSKSSNTISAKRGRPRLKSLKTRQNISIDARVLKLGRKLAFGDGLSFSAMLEKMVRDRIQETIAIAFEKPPLRSKR
jgi:hypothetical protein